MPDRRARMRLPELPRRRTRPQRAMHAAAATVWTLAGLIIGTAAGGTVPTDLGGIWYPVIVIATISGAIAVAAVLVRVGQHVVTDKYRRGRRG